MTVDPVVTVVIPTWNRKALVREAIASVAAQTYRNWELVVVDDGSIDGTVEQLRADGVPGLQLLALDHCGSMPKLRNAGVAAGSGGLVAFLDSDDLWLPRKLELQVAALHGGQARWCYGGYRHVDLAHGPVPRQPPALRPERGRVLRPLLLGETSVFIGTLMIERSLFDEVGGFDESFQWRADVDLALRLAAAADAVAIAETLALVREHSGRVTIGVEHPHQASMRPFDFFLARETDPDLRRLAHARRAELCIDAGLYRLARRDLVGGLRWLAAGATSRAGLAQLGRRLIAKIKKRRAGW